MQAAFTETTASWRTPASGPASQRGSAPRDDAKAEAEGFGKAAVTFRIKDWGISRQRYWGTPIPVIHCPKVRRGSGAGERSAGGAAAERSRSPARAARRSKNVPEFVNVRVPKCGGPARRETDTMDTFVDSSWYFYRYCDPHNSSAPFDSAKIAIGFRSISTSAAWSTPFCT
jgi:leucyl-tRNA synthetase